MPNKSSEVWVLASERQADFILTQNYDIVVTSVNCNNDVHKTLISCNCGPGRAHKFWPDGVNSTAYSRAVVEILEGLEVIENG